MYVGSDGTIHQGGQPWGMRKVIGIFWGFINFFVIFFKTMFNFETGGRTATNKSDTVGFGGPPDAPGGRRRLGRINQLPDCNVPGGG